MDRFSTLISSALIRVCVASLLFTLAFIDLYCETKDILNVFGETREVFPGETEERFKLRSRKIELKLWDNLVFELCMPSAPPQLLSFSCKGYEIGCHYRN